MRSYSQQFVVCAVLAWSVCGVARSAPLVDVVDAPVSASLDGTRLPLADVSAAILKACGARPASKWWSCALVKPGEITALLAVRGKHTARVAIQYSDTNYSLRYVTSENLNYKSSKSIERGKIGTRRTIHANYNKWVQALANAVNHELSAQALRPSGQDSPSH